VLVVTRFATGDYWTLRLAEVGCPRSSAFLRWQWLKTGSTTERGVVVRAWNMVDRYADTVENP
jgi:hypothetical protein